jgi:tRNA (cmo5U34)-methyltransferase
MDADDPWFHGSAVQPILPFISCPDTPIGSHPLNLMSDYRWNYSEFAVAYDQAAESVHPYYLELQDAILQTLAFPEGLEVCVVDMGGGSGRLIERILDKLPKVQGIVLDQSEPFLALAERRLIRFGSRATCVLARLQDDWRALLPNPPAAIVSMSAIHHLDPVEKQTFYQRCFDSLVPGAQFLNGDEVRPENDAQYLPILQEWVAMWEKGIASGNIPPGIHAALRGWTERNVTRFGEPKQSGDDCHETAGAQLQYLRAAGFNESKVIWHKKLWALLSAKKPLSADNGLSPK